MINEQVVKLTNVKTDVLKKYFKISSSIVNKEILNFSFDKNNVFGIANNETDAIYKKWNVPLTDICDTNTEFTQTIKCSIFKGDEFISKILTYFGQTANMHFHHVNGSTNKIVLEKADENGKVILSITIVCAPVQTSFVEYDESLLNHIFTTSEETKIASFTLSESELSEVSKLSKLGTNPEIKTNYISLYTDERGALKATDKCFDLELHISENPLPEVLEIDKSLWSVIESDKYNVNVHNVDGNKFIICKSQTSDVTITILLLSDVDSSVDFDDFDLS